MRSSIVCSICNEAALLLTDNNTNSTMCTVSNQENKIFKWTKLIYWIPLTTLILFKKFTSKETLIHAVWGFLNTKTYTIVLLLHMMNSGVTGKSLSEALIFASTNPQYDDRLFI